MVSLVPPQGCCDAARRRHAPAPQHPGSAGQARRLAGFRQSEASPLARPADDPDDPDDPRSFAATRMHLLYALLFLSAAWPLWLAWHANRHTTLLQTVNWSA